MFSRTPHKHIKTAFTCNTCKQIIKKARKMVSAGHNWREIESALTDRQWQHYELNYALIRDAIWKRQCDYCKGICDVTNAACPFCRPSYQREYVWRRQPEPQPQRAPDPVPVINQVPVADNRKASQAMIDRLYSRATQEVHKGNYKLADHLRSEARKRETANAAA